MLRRAAWLLLTLFAFCGLSQANTVLIPKNSNWRYLDNGSDAGTAWRALGFSDSTWKTGPGELGYGDSSDGRPEATVVGYGPDANNKYITTYFRHSFNVTDATAYGSLLFRVMRDDGVVVYLNGTEVWRDKMPTGTIGYRTLASAALGGADEYTYAEAVVPSTLLRTGNNVVAVEVHQANATSTDLSFDLELTARAPGFVRHPYLQLGTPTSMTIRWRTDIATDSVVRYGASPDALTQEVRLNATTPITDHEVKLTGLTPDTRYFYSVGSSATTFASGEAYVFYTAPPIGAAHPTRIWAIGDAGTGTAQQMAVRDAYLANAPGAYTDVMLMLGDNAYDNGTDSEFTTKHFAIYKDILRQTVTWPTIGNHDTASLTNPSSTIAYYNSFTLPKAGEAGGVASGTEDYYSFDYGDIHFVCLDSMTESRAVNGAMATWLQDDLANTTQKWIIVYFHHPPYSKGHDSDTETPLIEMRQNIVPILEDYGVDLVLCGHSHAYERGWLMDGHYGHSSTFSKATMVKDASDGKGEGGYNKPTFAGAGHEGAVYAVAGSSGKTQNYGLINDSGTGLGSGHPANYISWERLGSLLIEVDGHRMDVKFIRESGAIADSFSITRGPRTNALPTIAITSPAPAQEFNTGAPVSISTQVGDADQGLKEVVFYANASRIATVPASGLSGTVNFTWTPPATGNYRIVARAVDLLGNSETAAPVDIAVANGAPAPDTTAPAAVMNLAGVPGVTDVALSWRAPGDDGADVGTAANYDLRYSTANPAEDVSPDKANWWAAANLVTGEILPAPAGSSEGFTVSPLTPGTLYYFAIKTVDDAGNVSALSNIAAITTATAPPAGPSHLTATLSGGVISLAWTDNASDEDSFRVEKSTSPTSGFAHLQVLPADSTRFMDPYIYAGTTYYYRVFALKGAVLSAASNVAKITVPPAAPMSLSGSATKTSVNLTWNPSTGADSYTVSRLNGAGEFQVITSGLTLTQYMDGSLTPNTPYTYRVAAVNSGGAGAPAEITLQTGALMPPSAPVGLVATAQSRTEILLEWTDGSTNEGGFTLERSDDGETWALVAQTAANATVFLNNGLSAGSTFSYRIRAFNEDGFSEWSNVAVATTPVPVPPFSPTDLVTTALSKTSIELSWVDNAGNESGYTVERSTDGVQWISLAPALPADSVAFTNAGLDAGTAYSYRVRATNADGESAWSNVASATTLPLTPPAAPTAFAAAAESKTAIRLDWATASGATGYTLERSLDGATWAGVGAVLEGAAVSYTNTGLSAGTPYFYRLRASNADGVSAWVEASATTMPLTPPPTPSNVAAVGSSATSITVTWSDSSPLETAFIIERSANGGVFSVLATLPANTTSYVNTGLTTGVTYSYRVKATNSDGESAYAGPVSASTLSAPAAPSGLSGRALSRTAIELTWTDNSANEGAFVVQRSSDRKSYTTIATVGANAVVFTDSTVAANKSYYYRVQATNAVGSSTFSNVASVKTPR
jgi:acid phosphatase type 7